MLDAIVAVIALLLVSAAVMVMVGPRNLWRWIRSVRAPAGVPALFEQSRPREMPPTLNPKTQRVVAAAVRLASWLRAHGHEDAAREIRNASARMTVNEPSGLYALQTTLRRIRVVNFTDSAAHERLQGLVDEVRSAMQDRFEQLELLPFRRP